MRKNFLFMHNNRLARVAMNPHTNDNIVVLEYVGRYNPNTNFLHISRSRGRVHVPVTQLRPAHDGAKYWWNAYLQDQRAQTARGKMKSLQVMSYSEKYEKNLLG